MAGDYTPQREPQNIPLFGTITHRGDDYTKDYRFVNVIPEVFNNQTIGEVRGYLTKRDGLVDNTNPSGGAAVGRGMYYWARTGHLYTVFGNTLYLDGTSIQTLNTSTGPVSFNETQGGTPYLVLQDGADGWLVNTSDTVAQIVDADYPAATAQGLEVLDGYVFVINSASGEVYNSDLNDPTSWTANNFFLPEMYPDDAVALSRYRNLLVVLGKQSVEFYYDAANASGSPLTRVEQMAQEVGCASATTVARTDDVTFFVGTSKAGRSIYMIESDKFTVVSNEAFDRILNAEGSDITSGDGMIIEIQGHTCYALSLNTIDRTFCYDMSTGQWFEIASADAKFACIYALRKEDGRTYVQHRTDGHTYYFNPAIYQDDGSAINVTIQTGLVDLGTHRRKFASRLELIGDYTGTTNEVSVSWSDDDYQTFSTARTVDTIRHMFLRNLGQFRRRAHKLTHTANMPLRLEKIELEFELGSY